MLLVIVVLVLVTCVMGCLAETFVAIALPFDVSLTEATLPMT